MLDLNKLEKQLDEALAKESPESLTNWLLNNRKKNYINYLGEGHLEPMSYTFPEVKIAFYSTEIKAKVQGYPKKDYRTAA